MTTTECFPVDFNKYSREKLANLRQIHELFSNSASWFHPKIPRPKIHKAKIPKPNKTQTQNTQIRNTQTQKPKLKIPNDPK